MPANRHTKIRKIIDPVVMVLARLIRLTRVRPSMPPGSALTDEFESQEIHRKLDRIESALKEIDLALKQDDTQSLHRCRNLG